MAIGGVLRRRADRLALAGHMEVDFLGTQRDPHIGPVRAGDAMIEEDPSKAGAVDRRLVGFVEDVPRFLNGLDAFVLPSLSEGFSLSTVQALASALPVLATRSGGPEEIVEHDSSGLLVAPGDAEALAAGLASLATDDTLRTRLASNARARALSAFSVDSMLTAYSSLHFELMSHG